MALSAALCMPLSFVPCGAWTVSPSPAKPAFPAQQPRFAQEIQITGDAIWVDTGIDLKPGEHLQLNSTGALRYADASADNGPEGSPRGFKDLLRIFPDNDAGRGALLARIGDKDVAEPFVVGLHREMVSPVGGRLFLGINQATSDKGDGTYKIVITIYPPDANFRFVAVQNLAAMDGIDQPLFATIPRRVTDKAGNLGDMVNFLILGTQAQMEQAFKSAGWVRVDVGITDTLLSGVIASVSKQSYLTMPMSPLYLFGRTQDYGWAHAEPLEVVASRNHLRIWRAPFQVHGETVWVGAATHDVGFEHDQRDSRLTSITHKIDPNIDLEREYVRKTLATTGLVVAATQFLPDDPVLNGKTATGESFHSNGKVLVLQLAAPK
jgi:LssY-like putative type I secretion system component LssY